MKKRTINFTPPGIVAASFMKSNAFVRGLMGPVGSGKSVACVMEMMRRSREQKIDFNGLRRSRWAVVRNTYPELQSTTMKTFFDWFPKDLGKFQPKGPPTFTFKSNDVEAEFLFLALDRDDDVRKLLSLELTGVWFNEARYIEKSLIDAATGRVGRFPSKRDGGVSWSGIIMDTNPPTTESWWYNFAEEDGWQDGYENGWEPGMAKWEFFSQPSGLHAEAENIQNLSKGRKYYEDMLSGKTKDYIAVYVHGRYGLINEGKPVFPTFLASTHMGETLYIKKREVIVGIDFGLTPAAVFAQEDARGRWLIQHELTADNMGAKRFAVQLKRFVRRNYPPDANFVYFGDPAGVQRAQTDEATVFKTFSAQGLDISPAPTNNLLERLEAVRAPLDRMVDGQPGLIIDKMCKGLGQAMVGGYCYRKLRTGGGERFTEKPDKNRHSHIADALQYCMLGGGEGVGRKNTDNTPRQKMTDRRSNPFQTSPDY